MFMQSYPTTRQAARILGVSHPTVIRKMQKYKLVQTGRKAL